MGINFDHGSRSYVGKLVSSLAKYVRSVFRPHPLDCPLGRYHAQDRNGETTGRWFISILGR